MNRKVRKTFIGAFLATSLFMGVNSVSAVTIKETTVAENENLDKIESRTFIVGATKFNGVALTAGRVIKATDLYAKLNKDNIDYKGAGLYYYIAGEWYTFDDDNKPIEIKDTKELAKLNSQAIYYVNNEEKVLEIPYTREVDDGYTLKFKAGETTLKYVDDKIQVPATVSKVEVYAVKGETETKLDEFSKSNLEDSTYEVKSSLGSITYGKTTDDSTITIDNIAWASSTSEKASGYYATVKINVPKIYEADYSKATYYIDELGEGAEATKLDVNALTQELKFDKANMTHKIYVTWDNGNTQVFTVTAKALGAAKAGTVSYGETTSVDNKLTINSVEWYAGKETIANNVAGNYAIVKISTKDYSTSDLAGDENAKYYVGEVATPTTRIETDTVEVTLKFDKDHMTQKITVEWEKGNIQVFEVTAKDLKPATAGSLTNDIDTATSNFTYENNTATINGNIKWYSKGATTDSNYVTTTAGNFKSVIINAPDIYKSSESVQVQVYNGSIELSKENWNVNSAGTKYSLALNFAITKEYKVVVTWETGNVQTFIVKLGENAVLTPAISGTISYKEASSASELTITEEIKYSKAVTEDAPIAAGNYATVTINVPEKYQTSNVIVKVGTASTIKNAVGETLSSKTTITKELNFATSKEYIIEVTWEDGNVQTFKVNATDVEAAPVGTIAAEGLTLNEGKLSGTVNYVKGKGNVITYVITAPDAYTDGDNSANAKVTVKGYSKDSDVPTILVEDEAFNASSDNKTHSIPRTINEKFVKDEITVVWENGNTQVFTIEANGLTLAEKPNYITTLKIESKGESKEINTIIVGKTLDLEVTPTAEDASKAITNSNVKWTSDDENVAKVDQNGVVTAIGYGTATITVAAQDGSGITATYGITVNYAPIVDESDYDIDGASSNKIVTFTFAASGGADKNNFVLDETVDENKEKIKKAFTYTYTVEKDRVKLENENLTSIAKYDANNNILTLTIKDNSKYEVKYTISQEVTYANEKKITVTTDELSKVVQDGAAA